MATKVVTGTYPVGYYLNPAYDTLSIASTADVEGTGVTTSSAQPSTIFNDGKVNGSTNGISLADGGAVSNHAGASVTGDTAILSQNGYTKIVNGGTITSRTVDGTYEGRYDTYSDTYAGPSIVLQAGGKVSQTATNASISNGITISGAAGEVINRGSINGSFTSVNDEYERKFYGYSIELDAGGSVNNGANGATSAVIKSGIKIAGVPGVVTNNGTINGANFRDAGIYTGDNENSPAIVFTAGGSVINGTGSNAAARIDGVMISGGRGDVTNIGKIFSPRSLGFLDSASFLEEVASIQLSSGGSVKNAASGSINGISITGARGTIDNAGELTAPALDSYRYRDNALDRYDFAVRLGAGGRITNRATGTVAGISIAGGRGTVSNAGAMTGPTTFNADDTGSSNTTQSAIVMAAGGIVTNTASGSIAGIAISGARGTVDNAGALMAPVTASYTYGDATLRREDFAVRLGAGGSVANGAAGTIGGVSIAGGNGTVSNAGTITGPTVYQADETGSSTTTNFSVVLTGGGTIVNGSASNAAASLANGVSAAGGPTKITNFGTIGANSDGTALIFDQSSDTLIEEGSGTITGTVMGADSKLILAADAGPGSIGGFGSTIDGFRSIDVVAGGDWTFTGVNMIRNGTTLSDEGTLHIDDRLTNNGTFDLSGSMDLGASGRLVNLAHGTVMLAAHASIDGALSRTDPEIVNSGLIEKRSGSAAASITGGKILNDGEIEVGAGTLSIASAISGRSAGTLQIDGRATLDLGGAVDDTQTVVFRKTTGVLQLDDSVDFDGTLSRFRTGNKIDLTDFARQGSQLAYTQNADHTEGTLTVTNGDQVATLTFDGAYRGTSFRLRNDGHGGSNLVYLAPAGQSSAPTNGDPAFTQSLFAAAFGGSAADTHAPVTTAYDIPATMAAGLDLLGAAAKA